jgi:hypothetical protein
MTGAEAAMRKGRASLGCESLTMDSGSHGASYLERSGISVDLDNAVAQRNHIAAGTLGSRTGWILRKFCLVRPQK